MNRCGCPGRKHVVGCPSRRGPKILPTDSRGFKVLSLFSAGPMTLDVLKGAAVRNFVYADGPGLRRSLAKSVYQLVHCGYLIKRGRHKGLVFTKFRQWKITPAGRAALGKSHAKETADSVAAMGPVGSCGTERHPLRVFHPSEMIDEEMQARGWDIPKLAMAMVAEGSADPLKEYGVHHLAVELYFSAGPTNKMCRMGPEFISGLSRAFGTTSDLWENLEKQWLEAWPSGEPTGAQS